MASSSAPSGGALSRAAMAAACIAGASGSVGFVLAPSSTSAPATAALRGGQQLAAPGAAPASFGSTGTAACAATVLVGAAATLRRRGKKKAATVAPRKAAQEQEAPPPFDPAKQVGVTLPLMYFDPAGFSKVGDREGFYNLRCAELKHGRVAMMASLGMVAQHFLKLPGFGDVPAGAQAAITPPGTFGLVLVAAAAGAVETQLWAQDPSKEPGDFGDPAGIGQYYLEWRNRELNNGRFAMIAFFAIVIAELASGKDGVDQIWTPLSNLPVE
eukprot:TRINITY_DN1291_c0_g2_i1.p1 TRINITY_DN1291_c0_g2~~TRINITY_DN1291_c0_g2_i1.p1  ORF type:complete len:293 (-),score=83.51 TRINITY_DN1291_c0_g2_i1:189-1001(-)